jgi:hypothetical protein
MARPTIPPRNGDSNISGNSVMMWNSIATVATTLQALPPLDREMLTPEQIAEFHRFGILRMPGAVPFRDANAMCDSVWEMLARRYHIRRDDPETWKSQRVMGTRDIPASMTCEQVASPAVRSMFDDLLGADAWDTPELWGSLLVSFPDTREQWQLPYQSWHLDAPVVRSLPGLYSVRMFTCLAKLAPQGGATLAVAGSARLAQGLAGARGVARMRSADVRKALIQRYRWMKELCSSEASVDRVQRFMNSTTTLEDVDVRVVEITGEPGDVILTHPLTLHAASPNCVRIPRIALSTTVYQRGVNWHSLYDADAMAANP